MLIWTLEASELRGPPRLGRAVVVRNASQRYLSIAHVAQLRFAKILKQSRIALVHSAMYMPKAFQAIAHTHAFERDTPKALQESRPFLALEAADAKAASAESAVRAQVCHRHLRSNSDPHSMFP